MRSTATAEPGGDHATSQPSDDVGPLRALVARFDALGVESYVHVDARGLHLGLLVVHGQRHQGLGTAFMVALTRLADQRGWTVALTPELGFGATSVARLERFYHRFGFVGNRGRRPELSERMYREPRPVHSVASRGLG
jgi:GNAT superfamily N-acetyltransferase